MHKKYKIPNKLHEPVQILWFYQDEVIVIALCYMTAIIAGGLAWFLLLFGPYLYIRIRRNNPRGYLEHQLISWGILKLKHYPSPFIREFWE